MGLPQTVTGTAPAHETTQIEQPSDSNRHDHVSELYRACQRRRMAEPRFEYEQVAQASFRVSVYLDDISVSGLGPFGSKKVGKAEACRVGLQMLNAREAEVERMERGQGVTEDGEDGNGEENWIGALNEYQQRHGYSQPEYKDIQLPQGFAAEVHLPQSTVPFQYFAGDTKDKPCPTKKAAKRAAAKEAVLFLRRSGRTRGAEELEDDFPNQQTNWIGILNEYQQHRHRPLPTYEDLKEGHYFVSQVSIPLTHDIHGSRYTSNKTSGYSTKREAKVAAAKEAVQWLRHDGDSTVHAETAHKRPRMTEEATSQTTEVAPSVQPVEHENNGSTNATQPIQTSNPRSPHLGDNIADIPSRSTTEPGPETQNNSPQEQHFQEDQQNEPSPPAPQNPPGPGYKSCADRAAQLAESLGLGSPIYTITSSSNDAQVTNTPHTLFNGVAVLPRHESLVNCISTSGTTRSTIPRETATRDILVAEVHDVAGKKKAREALARDVLAFLENASADVQRSNARRVREFREAFAKRHGGGAGEREGESVVTS